MNFKNTTKLLKRCVLVTSAVVLIAGSVKAVNAYSWTKEVAMRMDELYNMGLTSDQVYDQCQEEFDGVDGYSGTGGLDGLLLDGSIAPNGPLAGTSGGNTSSGGDTAEKPHTHAYKETERVEATCSKEGKITSVCECGKTKTETLPVLAHNLEAQPETMDPGDCMTEGTVLYKCSMCDYTETIVLSKGEHAFKKDEKASIPALCESEGKDIFVCTICGEIKEEVLNVLGHIWETEYSYDVKPTCVTAGSKSYHCERCDKAGDNKVIEPATGHDIRTVTEENSSFWADGKAVNECRVCGEIISYEVIEADGRNYLKYGITLLGIITCNILGILAIKKVLHIRKSSKKENE